MRRFFALVTGALALVVLCGTAFTYDGGYYLYRLLADRELFVPNRRTIHGILELPTFFASTLTHDHRVFYFTFGLCYISVILIALLASWWVVRKENPALFLWAAFGILIAPLPGQVSFISEIIMLMQLAWPLYLGILTRLQPRHLPIYVLFGILTFFSYPLSGAIFGIGAVLAFIVGWFRHEQRMIQWTAAAVLLIVAGIAMVRFVTGINAYESEQLGLGLLLTRVSSSVLPGPVIYLVAAGLAALLLLTPYFPARWLPAWLTADPARLVRRFMLVMIISAVLWAAIPTLWIDALSYRFFIIPMSLPFIVAALIDSLAAHRTPTDDTQRWQQRRPLIQLIGLTFALVLSIQSIHWLFFTTQLRNTLLTTAQACLNTDSADIRWTEATALNHWAIAPYALLLQGNAPRTLVMRDQGCTRYHYNVTTGFLLADWDWQRWDEGWLDWSTLRERLR